MDLMDVDFEVLDVFVIVVDLSHEAFCKLLQGLNVVALHSVFLVQLVDFYLQRPQFFSGVFVKLLQLPLDQLHVVCYLGDFFLVGNFAGKTFEFLF